MALVDDAAHGQSAVKGIFRLAAALLIFLALAGCGDRDGSNKPATQVAARVNSSEISIHQVNFALQHTPGLAPELVDEAKRQILDELVDQELAVQQALAAKLDRDPNIMQSIDAARRDILARAFLEQVTAGVGQPTPEDIARYYREHPELFTGRKIYHLQEILLPPAPEVMAMVREQLAQGKSAAELESWFKGQRLKIASRAVIKPAEKVDLEILPKLAKMKEGQTALFESGDTASVITVLAVIPEPLAEDDARPLIDGFLKRQRSEALEKETTRQLRAKAKIEYLGEFSPDAEMTRKRKAAAAARQIENAKAVREAARQARAAETSGQRPGGGDPVHGRPASFASPSESAISNGVAGLR